MLSFDDGDRKFNYRVAGVAIAHDHVLIHKAENEPFWSLPGGRGEFFEPSADTMRREVLEELGVTAEVNRLLWIAENFYSNNERRYHELAWYYEITLPGEMGPIARPEPFFGDDCGVPVEFRWHPLDRLHELTVQPRFLYDGLKDLPTTTAHIVENTLPPES